MSKYKIGDEFVVTGCSKPWHGFWIGARVTLDGIHMNSDMGCFSNNARSQYINFSDVELAPKFENSNRNKLKNHIKKYGLSNTDLSALLERNRNYFSSLLSETKFKSDGDISDKLYKSVKKSLKEAVKNSLPVVCGNPVSIDKFKESIENSHYLAFNQNQVFNVEISPITGNEKQVFILDLSLQQGYYKSVYCNKDWFINALNRGIVFKHESEIKQVLNIIRTNLGVK